MNLYDMLTDQEKAYHDALVAIVQKYGPMDKDTSSIWVGYQSPDQNEDSDIGVKCGNCAFHNEMNNGQLACKLVSFPVEEDGKCRLAAIPDGLVNVSNDMMDSMDHMNDNEEDMYQKSNGIFNLTKAEKTFSPTSGMKSAARRALKWKEEGKATGAGTPVGWGRATDIISGRPMSLSVVRRMYSFFSRHEVDKKGKDFYNTSNPSNGRIMWDAWGGDAGFSWSRAIVRREASKDIWTNSPLSFEKNRSSYSD